MTTLSLASARASFSKLVESAATTHERFEVTRNGERAAVLLGADDYDSLIETLEILQDPELVATIQGALEDLERGNAFTQEEVAEVMRQRSESKDS